MHIPGIVGKKNKPNFKLIKIDMVVQKRARENNCLFEMTIKLI